jgi:hypothetical protein
MNDGLEKYNTGVGSTGENMSVQGGLPSAENPEASEHSNEGTAFGGELPPYTSPVGENGDITPQIPPTDGEVTSDIVEQGTDKAETPLTEETAQLLVSELQQFNSSVEMLHRIMTDTKFPNSVHMLGRMLSDPKINNLIRALEGNLGSRY